MPTISATKFNNPLSQWIRFHDFFNSFVNAQTTLSNIDKLNYISHALQKEDARAMQQFGISKAHYDHAWVKLKERYENSETYIEHHTQSLYELAPMSKNTYVEFRRMINDAKNYLVASERVRKLTRKCASLLINILSKKLNDKAQK